jgi:hypothetical protein
MPHINAENRETFEIEWAEHQTYLELTRLEGVRKMAEQQKEMDNLKARIADGCGWKASGKIGEHSIVS